MSLIDKMSGGWNTACKKMAPFMATLRRALRATGTWLVKAWNFLCHMRKVIAAIPVGVGAVVLALYNQGHLPAKVGIGLQSSGDFTMLIDRELAVLGPIAITALCLLLMFLSKRTLTPWLVSLFTLAVPVLILVTNIFPA